MRDLNVRRRVRIVTGLLLAATMTLVSYAVHRADPVQVDAMLVTDRGGNVSATARARVVAETMQARLDDGSSDVVRSAVTTLGGEPTIQVSVEAVDEAVARHEVDAIVAEILEIGQIEWRSQVVAERTDLQATLDTWLSSDDPPNGRQIANITSDIDRLTSEMEGDGNAVSVVHRGTSRPATRPLRNAAVVGLVTLAALAAAEVVLGAPEPEVIGAMVDRP